MPTYDTTARFLRDLQSLTTAQRQALAEAIRKFVEDLQAIEAESGVGFRKGLRVKRVVGTRGVWEMTWDGDGRCTFEYGDEVVPGLRHVIWRRVGTHAVFADP